MKDYLKIKEELKENLSGERYKHTLYTQKEAVKLAKRYNANIDKTSLAALLHDCAKDMEPEKMIKLVENQRMRLDKIERLNPSLLHAIAGEIVARYHFKVTDREILSAIKCHTTGKEKMTLLEKIIFIADVIEEGRQYDGVEAIREMAYQDIDQAIIMKLDNTIEHIINSRKLLHPNTVAARNYLIMERQERQRYINKVEVEVEEVRELEEFDEDIIESGKI